MKFQIRSVRINFLGEDIENVNVIYRGSDQQGMVSISGTLDLTYDEYEENRGLQDLQRLAKNHVLEKVNETEEEEENTEPMYEEDEYYDDEGLAEQYPDDYEVNRLIERNQMNLPQRDDYVGGNDEMNNDQRERELEEQRRHEQQEKRTQEMRQQSLERQQNEQLGNFDDEVVETGGGWYQLPDGTKVQGKENARKEFDQWKKGNPNVVLNDDHEVENRSYQQNNPKTVQGRRASDLKE